MPNILSSGVLIGVYLVVVWKLVVVLQDSYRMLKVMILQLRDMETMIGHEVGIREEGLKHD
jgi:hypothetical protein